MQQLFKNKFQTKKLEKSEEDIFSTFHLELFSSNIHIEWNINPPCELSSELKDLFKFMRNDARNGNLIPIKSNEMYKIYDFLAKSSHALLSSYTPKYHTKQWRCREQMKAAAVVIGVVVAGAALERASSQ